MSVYIDRARIPFRHMLMCHMIADSHDELIEMAERVGVNPKWIQAEGTYREHFDVCWSKREEAVELGVIGVSNRELGEMLRERRKRGAPYIEN